LADRARDLIQKAGYTDMPADSASTFGYDYGFVQNIRRTDKGPHRRDKLIAFNPTWFAYRQSQHPIEREIFNFRPDFGEDLPTGMPLQFSGDVLVGLDNEGRLRGFLAMPPRDTLSNRFTAAQLGPFAFRGRLRPIKPDLRPSATDAVVRRGHTGRVASPVSRNEYHGPDRSRGVPGQTRIS
jgi:hypothetical protein